MEKIENLYAIISVTALQKYVFFEIRDQEVINSLEMVLIQKSETRGGGGPTEQKSDFTIKSKSSLH